MNYVLIWYIRKVEDMNMVYPHDINMVLPSGVIKHGWLENHQFEWRFLARKIIEFYGSFFMAMFDYQRVMGKSASGRLTVCSLDCYGK